MKKIISLVIFLIFVYSGVQFNKAFSSNILKENITKEDQKEEMKSDDIEVRKDEISTTKDINDNNTQERVYHMEEDQEANIENNEVIYDRTIEKEESVQEYEPISQIDDSVEYEIYSVDGVPKDYTSYEECKTDSISVSFSKDARTMCYEAYVNSNGQEVYYIQINY